ERGELRGAEVADDRGVGQQVERLGGQRAKCRDGEAEDLAVVLPAGPHRRDSTMLPMRCRTALLLGLSMMSVAACAQESPPMPSTCTDTDPAGYERALTRAPGAVRLPGDVAIS